MATRLTQWDWCGWYWSRTPQSSGDASARPSQVYRELPLAIGPEGGGGVCVRFLPPAPMDALLQQAPSDIIITGIEKRFGAIKGTQPES